MNKRTKDLLRAAVTDVRPGAVVNPLRMARSTIYRYLKKGWIRKSGSFLQLTEAGARGLGWAPPHERPLWERIIGWFKGLVHG